MLAALSAGATVIAILVAFRSQREAQTAIFPMVREQESVRAQRARLSIFVWIAITALFIGGWLASLRLVPSSDTVARESELISDQPLGEVAVVVDTVTPLFAQEPAPMSATPEIDVQPPTPTGLPTNTVEPLPLPSATPALLEPPPASPTPEPSATFTSIPTDTPIPATATPTLTPTSTPTPFPTATPSPVGGILIPTFAPRTPAPGGARMGPIEFAENVTEELEAINPADIFPDGITAVYAIYPFQGIPKGVEFATVWYKDGLEVARDEAQWQYGEKARSFSFLVPRGEGLYKLELYVNDTIMASDLFEVR
jgi:hypothetical protein